MTRTEHATGTHLRMTRTSTITGEVRTEVVEIIETVTADHQSAVVRESDVPARVGTTIWVSRRPYANVVIEVL